MTRRPISILVICIVFAALTLMSVPHAALASVEAQAGAYRVEMVTRPAVIALGKGHLVIRVTDASGQPIDGATIRSLTKMPGMSMGEREVTAVPEAGQPGVYTAPAQFAMEGRFDAALTITGPQGTASTVLALNTGQDTGVLSGAGTTASPASGARGVPVAALLPWLIGAALLVYILYRVWRTGQRPSLRTLFSRPVIGSLLLLGIFLGGAVYAVHMFRRPGAMTPVEAQAMQMELPAPAGTAPVELASVERGPIENTVRYTGQALGFVEQDVAPRVTGVIAEMPVYVGDRVQRGQVLARLDTSQSTPIVASQRAGLEMAEQGVDVARKDYQQALAGIREAHAEVGTRVGALEGAKADVKAAEEDRINAQAQLDAAQSMVPDANAQLQAAQADQRYWQQEIAREQSLLKAGAVTQEEYQRERAQADNANAKVQQADARIAQVQAQVRQAQSAVRKSEATIASAQSKIAQTQAELNAHDAHVRSTDAMAASAQQKISQAQAAVRQAQATLSAASATQGYSVIRAQADGVITQRVVSPGVLVNPGQVLLRIAQIAPIRLQANVAEADLTRVHVGDRVRIQASNRDATPILSHISSVAPQVDPTSRTGVVEVLLPNQDRRFLPGQYVTLEITIGARPDTLLIPTRALRYHTPPAGTVVSTQAVPTVWVAEPAGGADGRYTVQEVTVQTGSRDRARTEILSGLKEGQKIVTSGQDYLKSGDSVSAVAQQSVNAAAAASDSSMGMPKRSGADHTGMAGMPGMSAPQPAATHTLYTCLMHPEVVQDHPGNCPKCGMRLVPKRGGGR